MPRLGVANWIGTSLLPFTNPRVVCPPGTPAKNGRMNVVVATPMRSGTHLMLDLLLNNVAAYRTRPLYIDLDQCRKQSSADRNLVGEIGSDAGQLIKTHLPIGVDAQASTDADVLRVIDSALVVTVRRNPSAVLKSLARAGHTPDQLRQHEDEFDRFWEFWEPRSTMAIDFESLFDGEAAAGILRRIASTTDTSTQARLVLPTPQRRRRRIYANKAVTRLVGQHAPRVDTTIHTLKS